MNKIHYIYECQKCDFRLHEYIDPVERSPNPETLNKLEGHEFWKHTKISHGENNVGSWNVIQQREM